MEEPQLCVSAAIVRPVGIHVALLRGINLGGHHRVPMAELRTLLTDAGYDDVRTYVQSGNIVLGAGAAAGTVQRDLQTLISDRFGFEVPVVVRSRAQLAEVVAGDPFGDAVTEPKLYQVTFLDRPLPPEAADRLQALRAGSERLVVRGRHIYAWLPDGIARSKMSSALAGAKLEVTATARNWRTVLALLALSGG